MASLTITEKIIASHAAEGSARAGQIVTVTPTSPLNDVSGPLAFAEFAAMGATSPAAPERVVLVADHFAPPRTSTALRPLARCATLPAPMGLDTSTSLDAAHEHSLLDELGLVGHGSIVFGADSHTCTAGASGRALALA